MPPIDGDPIDSTDIGTTGLEHEEQSGGEPEGGGDNPAWADIRNQLDETTYGLIKPHLTKFDQSAQQRIESVNKQYGWAKQYIDGGKTPDDIAASIKYAEMLSNNPVDVFKNLAGYLQQNAPEQWAELSAGFTPAQQQAAAQGTEGLEYEEVDPRYAELERRQAAVEQQAEAQRRFFEQQAVAQERAQVDNYVTSKLESLQEARPDLQKGHWYEILGYAASQTELRRQQGNGQPMELEEAVQWFDSLRDQFLAVPRPGDSAPALLPLGGNAGNPASPQRPDYSKMSENDIVEMIARDVASKNQQQ